MQVQIDRAVRGPQFFLQVECDDIGQWTIRITGNLTPQLFQLFTRELLSDFRMDYIEDDKSYLIESIDWLSKPHLLSLLAAVSYLITQVKE